MFRLILLHAALVVCHFLNVFCCYLTLSTIILHTFSISDVTLHIKTEKKTRNIVDDHFTSNFVIYGVEFFAS